MSKTDAQSRSYSYAVSLDRNSIPFPLFVVRRGEEVVTPNRRFLQYIHVDSPDDDAFTISGLEQRFACSLRPAIHQVLNGGEAAVMQDMIVCDECGDVRHASIHFMPTVSESDPIAMDCVGIIMDFTRLRIMENRLGLMQSELSIVSQVSAQLGSMMNTEEIFKIILIAVTAREGLGFNRAFILLLDEQRGELVGHHAIGPVDAEEAGEIWRSIPDEGKDLRTVIRDYRSSINLKGVRLNSAVRSLRYAIGDNAGLLAHSVVNRKCMKVTDNRELSALAGQVDNLFGRSELAMAPLFAKETVHGIVVADNLITNRPIADSDLEQLQMFANQGAIAIERAHLYETLQANAEELANANRQLERTQKEMIKIERFSLMGEMTYRIAHELRNPLTVIGGFASLLLKTGGMSDTARERASIIKNECTRIEKQLDILLDFSKSYSQEKCDVDLGLLLNDVIGMLQPRLLGTGVVIMPPVQDCSAVVHAHKEQLLHGLYSILSVLGESSPSHGAWRTSVRSDSRARSIVLQPDQKTMEHDEAVSAIRRLMCGQSGAGDLRLSLANEAISYNGGELGFALDESDPMVFIEFES